MGALMTKVAGDLRRRRLQAAVVFVTALLAVGTGTMALTLMAQTHDPYLSAFEAQKGAHLQVAFDGGADPRALASTPALLGAVASGGPYPATNIQVALGSHKLWMTTIGRDDPGGPVEHLHIAAGHWPANVNEIALTQSFADLNHLAVGDRLRVISVAQEPELTVAATVVDIDEAFASVTSTSGANGTSGQHAWMLSAAILALGLKGSSEYSAYFMNYRFAGAPTSVQLQADLTTLRSSLPAGSVIGSSNYLLIRTIFNITTTISTAILLAFSVFALLATAAIVANLITGIVIAAYREIGIMKALGFTPLQVEAVFVLQMVLPAAAATVVAIPLGTVASQPLLASSAQALGLPYTPVFSPGLDALALVGALVIVTVAALAPAFRAGRLKPAAIITNASAPHGQSGRWLRHLAARAHLPRPIALGAGDAFARPLRAILTLTAIFIGVATVTAALSLPKSVGVINSSVRSGSNVDVEVHRSPTLADADALRILGGDAQTARVVSELDQTVAVPSIGDPVAVRIFRGDSSRLGLLLVSGRWFNGPGEAVAPLALMQDAHVQIGDHVTVTVGNKPVSLLLVGESYDVANLGYSLFLDWSTVSAVEPATLLDTYLVTLTPGANVDAYVSRIAAAQPDRLDVQRSDFGAAGPETIFVGVLLILAAIIIVIGAAAIFNTLLLNTRERLRETATLKALGMSPAQVMVMVAASAALLAVVGGVIAVPVGVWLNRALLILSDTVGGNDTPPALYNVFSLWQLVAIPLVGVVVAMAAALLPGRWAARQPVAEVLHTE